MKAVIHSSSLFLMALRGGTLASKFILITYLAKFSSIDILANYSIIAITISFMLYLLGFDFYTFSTREIAKRDYHNSGWVVINQFSFYLLMYLVSVPLVFLLAWYRVIPSQVIVLFYILLITEHLAQEFMRLIVISGNALKANMQLFIRSASWIYIYIIYSFIQSKYSLMAILSFWIFGNLVSLFFSITELKKINWKKQGTWHLDAGWVTSGIKIALPLLAATLMLRGIYISDRYILKFTSDSENLAVYSFFSNIANALVAFLDAAVVMVYYPRLVSLFEKKDIKNYDLQMRLFKSKLLKTGVMLSLCLGLVMPFLCVYLNKNIFLSKIVIFYTLLFSSYIYSYSLIYHYKLYSMKKDKLIITSTLIAFSIGVLLQYFLGIYFAGYGVALGTLISSMILLYTKRFYSKGVIKKI